MAAMEGVQKMNKRLCVSCFLIVSVILFGDTQLDNKISSLEYPFIQPGEVDINLKTEKDKYCIGEVISLEIEICNLKDRRIAVIDIPNAYMRYFGVDVLGPYRPSKVVKHKDSNESERKNGEPEVNPKPVKRTLRGELANNYPWIRFKDCIIPPYGKLKYRIPLSMNFDFLNAEHGEYIVSINCDLLKWDRRNNVMPKKELIIKKSCKFEIINEAITSISKLTADYMVEVFSRENAIYLLCSEADALISRFKRGKEQEWRMSEDYAKLRRFLSILCTASGIHYYDGNIDYLEERNLMHLDEFEKLVQRCKARRLKMFHNEAEELLSYMEKMNDDKWKKSEEYSKFKDIIELLCRTAGIGYEEKNLEYLEKNNLLDLENMDDLLHNCQLKLYKVIPFYKE